MRHIFWDFDGTLIDSRQRLYRLFQDLVESSSLTFDEYWLLKRNQQDHSSILKNLFNETAEHIDTFQKNWLQKIEHDDYINIDTIFNYSLETLKACAPKYRNVLVTSRQNNDQVYRQLDNMNIRDYFFDVLITNQKIEKSDLIHAKYPTLSTQDYLIGDTGKDIQTAKGLGITSIAVLSGFRNKDQLLKYKPDYLIDNISLTNLSQILF